MSRTTALAEAIKDILTAASLSQGFTAVRGYSIMYALKDMTTLRVTVIPIEVDTEPLNRVSNIDTCTVDVVVGKKVDPSDNTACDAMATLTEEIVELLRGSRYKLWVWLSSKTVLHHDPESLSEWRAWTSVIRLQYQIGWN